MSKNTTIATSVTDKDFYDPNDLSSVENFWEGARIEHKGKVIGFSHSMSEIEAQKKLEPEVQVSLTLPINVLEYFKDTRKDWQTLMNEALLEYIQTHQ